MSRLVPSLLFVGIAAACADPYHPPEGDLEPPFVAESVPEDGAGDVGRRPELRLVFSEAIDPETVDGESILLLGPEGRIAGEVTAEERTAVFVPVADLREGAAFRLVARRTVRDLAGVPLAGDEGPGTDATIGFRTAAVPPEVTTLSPAHLAVDVAYEPAAPLTAVFSEAMDPATVDARTIVVRDTHGPVPGVVALDATGRTATFAPAAPWREGREYAVEIAAACADLSGIPMTAALFSTFTTTSDAPVLTPLEAGGGPPLIEGFVARFEASEALDPETVQPWNLAVEPAAAFRVSWVPASRFVEVAFTETLLSSVSYAVTAGVGIADDDGNHLAAPVVFRFTTLATPDNNAPGPITDLAAVALRREMLRFTFTAPGDDVEAGAAKGTAAAYELRRSRLPIRTLAEFEAGAPVAVEMPAPEPAGTVQAVDVPMGLYEPWHYALLAVDEAGNASLSPDLLAAIAFDDARAAGEDADGELGSALLVADLDGDGFPELIAGAPGTATVVIYAGTAAGPELSAPVTVLHGPSGSRFGAAIAVGDADADGDIDLLVGAPAEDSERGAAYLFATVDGLPEAAAAVVFRGTTIRDRLGEAVLLAELDGGGAALAIIGVPGGGAANEGLVLVAGPRPAYGGQKDSDPGSRRGDWGGWPTDPFLAMADAGDETGREQSWARGLPDPLSAQTISGDEAGEAFGSALASADLDGDGVPDLVIGAPGADVTGVDSGRVVFTSSTGLRRLAGRTAGERFGASLAVGDVDRDGTMELLVGAPLATGAGGELPAPDAGSIHLYTGPLADGALPLFTATGFQAEGRLGVSVSITGPLLDGMEGGMIAGAPGAPNAGGVRHGTVRLFHVAADRTVIENGTVAGPEAFDGFGACVAPAGDLDGDGLHDLAVGAPFADGTASAAGRVHLFR